MMTRSQQITGLLLALFALAVSPALAQEGSYGLARGNTLPPTCGYGDLYYLRTSEHGIYECTAADTWTRMARSTETGGGTSLPAGSIILTLSTCPVGFTEVASLSGKFLVATVAANGDVGTVGGSDTITPTGTVSTPTFTGSALSAHLHGAGTYAPSAHSGAAVDTHASHTHDYTQVLNHTHVVDVTDPGHTHTQNAHNHTQDAHTHTQNAHSHTVTSVGSAATGSTTNLTGASDTSSTTATAANATATNQNATATNQAATATNIANTTGVTASTQTPAGGVATGTTAGPSAALTHNVTQPGTHTMSGSSESVGAGTPSGTISQPTFTGTQFDNRPAYAKVIFCQKS